MLIIIISIYLVLLVSFIFWRKDIANAWVLAFLGVVVISSVFYSRLRSRPSLMFTSELLEAWFLYILAIVPVFFLVVWIISVSSAWISSWTPVVEWIQEFNIFYSRQIFHLLNALLRRNIPFYKSTTIYFKETFSYDLKKKFILVFPFIAIPYGILNISFIYDLWVLGYIKWTWYLFPLLLISFLFRGYLAVIRDQCIYLFQSHMPLMNTIYEREQGQIPHIDIFLNYPEKEVLPILEEELSVFNAKGTSLEGMNFSAKEWYDGCKLACFRGVMSHAFFKYFLFLQFRVLIFSLINILSNLLLYYFYSL